MSVEKIIADLLNFPAKIVVIPTILFIFVLKYCKIYEKWFKEN